MAVDVGLGLRRIAAVVCGLVGAGGAIMAIAGVFQRSERIPILISGLVIMGVAYGAFIALCWVINGFFSKTPPATK